MRAHHQELLGSTTMKHILLHPGDSSSPQAFVTAAANRGLLPHRPSGQWRLLEPRPACCSTHASAAPRRQRRKLNARSSRTLDSSKICQSLLMAASPRVVAKRDGRATRRGRALSAGAVVVMGDQEHVQQQTPIRTVKQQSTQSPSTESSGGFKGADSCAEMSRSSPQDVTMQQKAFVERVGRLGTAGRAREVEIVIEDARKDAVPFNLYMYNSCITAFGRCGRWRQAVDVLDGMRRSVVEGGSGGDADGADGRRDVIRPDVVSYSSAITACGNAGQWRRALALLRDMRAEGVPPNVVSYNAAAHACVVSSGSKHGSKGSGLGGGTLDARECWARVLGLLSEMRSEGVSEDAHTSSIAITACGRAGEWQQALSLIDDMGRSEDPVVPDVMSVNAAMAACARAGECEQALLILRRMISAHLTSDPRSRDDVLAATDGPPSSISSRSNKKSRRNGSRAGDQDVGNGGRGERLFPPPDVVSFNTAMEACAKVGRWREGATLLRQMREVGITPDVRSYGGTFACLRAGGQWARALDLLAEMEAGADYGLHADLGCYGIVMSTLAEAGEWERALEILRRLQDYGSAEPGGVDVEESETAGGVERRARSARRGAAVVSASAAAGPNLICFNTVLAACANAGAWSPALALLKEMEEQGLYNVISFNSVMHSFQEHGQWEQAIALLDRMRNQSADEAESAAAVAEAGISDKTGIGSDRPRTVPAPDVYSFTSAIMACGVAGQSHRALQVLRQMKASGVAPSVVPYNAAIAAIGRGVHRRTSRRDPGRTDGGVAADSRRSEGKHNRESVAAAPAADAALASDERPWEQARALLDEMRADGVTPNAISYNAVLLVCQRGGAWQSALQVLEEMKRGEVSAGPVVDSRAALPSSHRSPGVASPGAAAPVPPPDIVSFNTAIGACGTAGRWEEALALLDEISARGLSPTAASFHTAAAACSRAERWTEALDVLNRGVRIGLVSTDKAAFTRAKSASAGARRNLVDSGFYSSVVAMVRRTNKARQQRNVPRELPEGETEHELVGGGGEGRQVS